MIDYIPTIIFLIVCRILYIKFKVDETHPQKTFANIYEYCDHYGIKKPVPDHKKPTIKRNG